MNSKLAAIIGGIVGGSVIAFCCGLALALLVIMPARGGTWETSRATIGPTMAAHSPTAMVQPSPTPTYLVIFLTPEPPRRTATPAPSVTPSHEEGATPVPPPTATPRYPFQYVQGSMDPAVQCLSPYLQGWVRDADGDPLDGVVVQWQYWNNTEFAITGDPQKLWQLGEFKFTYYAQDPTRETDFILQIVESAQNPRPLSEPLVIHYAGCGETGQITNIVFRQR